MSRKKSPIIELQARNNLMIMIVVGSDSYSLVGSASYSRSLSQNFSKAADAPPHRYPWPHIERVQVLARESHGDFSSHGSFCLVQREWKTVSESASLKKHVSSTFLRHRFTQDSTRKHACLLHCELEELGNHLKYVAMHKCYLKSAAVKYFGYPRTQTFRG